MNTGEKLVETVLQRAVVAEDLHGFKMAAFPTEQAVDTPGIGDGVHVHTI